MIKNIFVITGSRADYGLLYGVIKKLINKKKSNFKLIVTGSHLSKKHGYTVQEIIKDGFRIDKKIKILYKKDSVVGISESIGIAIKKFTEYFNKKKPDIILILGDRFEMLSVAISSMVSQIPIAHIHGGELTHSAIDDSIRHTISKMAHLHFVTTNIYKKRLIQMGENPKNIFNVGALGAENIKKLKIIDKVKLEKYLKFKFRKKNILVTYHPVTLKKDFGINDFKILLNSLSNLVDIGIIFTYPNADTKNSAIAKLIQKFVSGNSNAIAFKSLGRKKYLSSLNYVDLLVGNSSSGIIEAPSIGIPSLNIGSRQDGRVFPKSVINCNANKKLLNSLFKKFVLNENKKTFHNLKNPYYKKDTSLQIIKILASFDNFKNLEKKFFDINFKN